MKREEMTLPLMMFGKVRGTRVKKDDEGNTIHKKDKNGNVRYNTQNKPIPEMKKVWIHHKREDGDQGIYPSVNHIYVKRGKGQRLSDPAQNLFDEWNILSKIWAKDNNWSVTEDEKIVVEYSIGFPNDKKKRDGSNVIKLLMDALEGTIYKNDEYALPRFMDFYKIKEGEEPHIKLNIYKKTEE